MADDDIDYLLEGDPREKIRWRRKDDVWGDPVFGSRATIAQLEDTNEKCLKRWGVGFEVLQGAYNSDVAASAGTHDFDKCIDGFIPRVDWWASQRFLRFTCQQFAYYRQKWQGFSNHIHMCSSHTYKTQVGVWVPGQITDYYNHAYGLAGLHAPGSDTSPFPDPITRFNYDQWKTDKMAILDSDIDKIVNRLLNTELTLSDGTTATVQLALRRAAQMPTNLETTAKSINDVTVAQSKATNTKVTNSRAAIMAKLDELDSQVGP